ncbi:MAG: vanadium-dependent haloperoxidase [Gemmatimonadetes bacterium]|nr:vanadium-dependent haloperoxidase [Gemmatimonadota bacterium]
MLKISLTRAGIAAAMFLAASCRSEPVDPRQFHDPELLHGAVNVVTNAMMESVTSPPVASRIYAYSSVAAYEALRPGAKAYESLANQLNEMTPAPLPETGEEYLLPVASVNAFLTVSEALVFAPEKVAAHRDSLVEQLRQRGVPRALLNRSLEYGAAVGRHVLAWAGKDGIKMARASARLEIIREPGRWVPTGPAYFDPVEPSWGMLRPFVLDSARQSAPPPPNPYDTAAESRFSREVREVYETWRGLTPEQRAIAAFWDCNPFAVQSVGHLMSTTKKISPGGHWMEITALVARKTDADMMRSAEAYARVSVALADGFISAWNEKYNSVRVRPETVIQERIDRRWQPLLQTPPFPEYPSGHSVISTAAAEVLTDLFGDDFAYTDDTEKRFGLPERSFTSFRHAAEEAAYSRLYGGIHYRDGVEGGMVQGRELGRTVVARLKTRTVRVSTR